jgi:predicted GNAT superfamily acetyltransferase
MSDTVSIRALRALDDMSPAVELQKLHWGEGEEAIVPAHMLFSLANYGGHVLAAFEGDGPNARMIGVLIDFLGTNMNEPERPAMANLQVVSKRMVIHPDYRSKGLGYRLKLAQRDAVIQQGIRLVTWTFDPLLAMNAYLNIRKLGAICHEYLRDYYGTNADNGLSTLGSSDRLAVEWWVTGRRVAEKLKGERGDIALAGYISSNATRLNSTTLDADQIACPILYTKVPQSRLALLEVPLDYRRIVEQKPAVANEWRVHTRSLFVDLFRNGFAVTDFVREKYEERDRAFYLLSQSAMFDFSAN